MKNLNVAKNENTEIFGSFFLAENEFALSVSFVQEVVNAPTEFTPVPLSPKYLKGLFSLRGVVVPVIDLRELLSLIRGQDSIRAPKIAIIELQGVCVGLLFDETGEVFRSLPEERSDFEHKDASEVISGVFKKEDGKRLVQILNVNNLFRLQNVPKEVTKNLLERGPLGRKRGSKKQCISFRVGPANCALPIGDIQEIIKVDRVNDSVLGFGACIGLIDLRGVTVPVIDFAALLEYRPVDNSDLATHGDRRVVVMRLGAEFFGLLVDSIDSIVSYFPDELVAFPIIEQKKSQMFLGCIAGLGSGDILLLNHQEILSHSEVHEITKGHSKIYQAGDSHQRKVKSKGGARRTYITVSLDGTFAVAINEVREIIDFPKSLLQPPGLRSHIMGVLNLRGDLVMIVDGRALYKGSSEVPKIAQQKVLVFNLNKMHFGLVVDSVESIVSFADNDKINLSELLFQRGEGSITSDVSEAIEIMDSNGQKRTLLILSLDSLSERVRHLEAA